MVTLRCERTRTYAFVLVHRGNGPADRGRGLVEHRFPDMLIPGQQHPRRMAEEGLDDSLVDALLEQHCGVAVADVVDPVVGEFQVVEEGGPVAIVDAWMKWSARLAAEQDVA